MLRRATWPGGPNGWFVLLLHKSNIIVAALYKGRRFLGPVTGVHGVLLSPGTHWSELL
jgi:hypothetical protein